MHALLEEHWKKEHSTTLKNDYRVRAAFLGVEDIQRSVPRDRGVDAPRPSRIAGAECEWCQPTRLDDVSNARDVSASMLPVVSAYGVSEGTCNPGIQVPGLWHVLAVPT